MTINILLILLLIIFVLGILAASFCLKFHGDLTKVQANLNSKVGTLMYVLPSLLNIYKNNIANFGQVNQALMINTKNFFAQKINLKQIHSFIDESQKDIDYLSQMLNKNFDQKKSFDTLYESIGFLENISPKYNLARKIAKICTFGLYSFIEKSKGFDKIKIIS